MQNYPARNPPSSQDCSVDNFCAYTIFVRKNFCACMHIFSRACTFFAYVHNFPRACTIFCVRSQFSRAYTIFCVRTQFLACVHLYSYAHTFFRVRTQFCVCMILRAYNFHTHFEVPIINICYA